MLDKEEAELRHKRNRNRAYTLFYELFYNGKEP